MGTLGQKLDYLTDTKSILKQKINNLGGSLTDQSTFRSYGDYLDELYNEMPKVTGEGTEITLTPTRKGRMQLDLKGNTYQKQLSGKNLLPNNLVSGTSEGITCTKNADGSISVNGTATARHVHAIYEGIFKAGTYTLSGVPSDNTIQKLLILYNTNTWVAIASLTNQSVAFTLASDTPVKLNITIPEGSTANNILIKPQLEQGSTATEYEQYCGGQLSPNPDYPQPIHVVTGNNTISIGNTDYPINLGSIELCEIGNYSDEIFKNEPNNPHYDSSLVEGGWYKYRIVYKTIINGNESFTPNKASSNINTTRYYTRLTKRAINNLGLSDNFINRNADMPHGDYEYIALLNNDLLFINILISRLGTDTEENFKSWLSTHNVTFYGVLATATSTQITDETLISQLDAIENAMSTTGTTIITQTNADLPFIISASALTTIASASNE